MIHQAEIEFIQTHAYVPEHLVSYISAISGAEPFLFDNYLCCSKDEVLIFIGYPLGVPFREKEAKAILDKAVKKLKPHIISLIAPAIEKQLGTITQRSSDQYYRLSLDSFAPTTTVKNMVRRASRELAVERGNRWGKEHDGLISEFLAAHHVSPETAGIFHRIPYYIAASQTVILLNARTWEGSLIAFDVADFGSKDYLFYMFNFASRRHYVPGASDLLLSEVVGIAREQGKKFVNLGLAINEGVTFFKKKWGGVPFLGHELLVCEASRAGIIDSLLGRL